MKTLFLALLIFTIISCEKPTTSKRYYEYDIVIFDSCEYIEYNQGMIHKGNCKNHKK